MTFPSLRDAFVKAGLVDSQNDPRLPAVTCFICEQPVSRADATYDQEFHLWECKACRKKWQA